jgi:hypothetical protein
VGAISTRDATGAVDAISAVSTGDSAKLQMQMRRAHFGGGLSQLFIHAMAWAYWDPDLDDEAQRQTGYGGTQALTALSLCI